MLAIKSNAIISKLHQVLDSTWQIFNKNNNYWNEEKIYLWNWNECWKKRFDSILKHNNMLKGLQENVIVSRFYSLSLCLLVLGFGKVVKENFHFIDKRTMCTVHITFHRKYLISSFEYVPTKWNEYGTKKRKFIFGLSIISFFRMFIRIKPM